MSPSIDLGSMRCFILLTQDLHFGRAAKRLNMTQPTLSQQIRKLEANLGVQLFARSTRSVELTPAGATFLPLAQEALIKLEEAVLLSKLAAGNLSAGGELLKISAIEPAAHTLLPRVLARFRKRFPDTRLEVSIVDSSELLRAMDRGESHVGFMRRPTNANLLQFRPLYSDRLLAVIPKSSPLANRAELRLTDFVGHRVFTLNRFEISCFRSVYDKAVAAGIELDTSLHASSTAAAITLATAGLGITFLPEWIEKVIGSEVVLRAVEDLTEELSIGISWRTDSPVPGVLPFVEYAELVSRQR